MNPNKGAVLVWGLHDPCLGLMDCWKPRSCDLWVGEADCNPSCTHDIDKLMMGDLSQWSQWPVASEAPQTLLDYIAPRMDVILSMFDRTFWGREVGYIEKRNQAMMLLRTYLGLVRSRTWRFAFFGAPPHFGCDALLKEVMDWSGVPVFMGCQLLFPDSYWVLASDFRIIRPPVAHPPAELLKPDVEQLFYMLDVRARHYGWWRLPLVWLKFGLRIGRMRLQPLFELKRVVRQRQYQQRLCVLPQMSLAEVKGFDRRFVYVPLHLQPEMTTSALGGDMYDNQATVVDTLLASLPADWSLLVKENPKQDWSHRSEAFFARLSRDARVRFVGRAVSGKALIAKADVVATVSGTSGWEAVRMAKPVVLLGRSWYAGFSGVSAWRAGIAFDSLPHPCSDQLKRDFDERIALAFSGMIDPSYGSVSSFRNAKERNGQSLLAMLDMIDGLETESSF